MTRIPDLIFRGGLEREPEISMPERHLGLVTADERGWDCEESGRLADWLEKGLDVPALLADLPAVDLPRVPAVSVSSSKIRLGVARDQAFCFYYQENLRLLEEAGAEPVFFFTPFMTAACPAICSDCISAADIPNSLPGNCPATMTCAGPSIASDRRESQSMPNAAG